jgi:hypothetical protein
MVTAVLSVLELLCGHDAGSLARAARLIQLGDRAAVAPAVESMLVPSYSVPQQLPPRSAAPAVVGVPARPQLAL